MAVKEFLYKGKSISIGAEDDGMATVDVDGRRFRCMHHNSEAGMPMWMCEEAYFGSFDIEELARHFADYGYFFDDPNRVVSDNDGNIVKIVAKKVAAKKPAPKKRATKKTAAKKAGV